MNPLRLAVLLLATLLGAAGAHAQIAFRNSATAVSAAGAYGTITHVGAGAVSSDNTATCPNTVSPAMPAGLANDVLIALVNSREDSATITATAGWTLAYAATYAPAGSELQAYIYYKIAAGTNTAADPLTITQTVSCNTISVQVSRFRGIDLTQPLETSPIPAGNVVQQNSNNLDTGTQNTSVNGSMLIVAGFINDNGTVTQGAGWSQSFDSSLNLNRDLGLSLHYQLQATAGAAQVSNWALTAGTDPNIGVIFALRPSPPTLTINVPGGTVAGDVMVASVAVRSSAVLITPPAGWAAQAATVQNGGNSSRQQIFYRVATGGEPASYTWRFDVLHTGAVGAIVSYSGVDTAVPIDAFSGNTTPQGADTQLQHRALSTTTNVADAMVISTHAFGSAATWTSAGVNERVDIASQVVPNAVGISLAIYDATQAVAGATGDRTATASGNGDSGSAHFIALRPFVPQPVLHWSMDQASWTGAAGEVVDLSGNALHGTSLNGANTANTTPAIPGSPGTCRYGAFDGVNDYLEVADNALLDVTDELTVMMWLFPTAYPTAGNLKSFVSKDINYEAHLASTGTINWWWGGGALQLNSAGTVPLNTWTHVTLVYSRAGAFQRIYLNGVQDANTNNQAGALIPNNVPFQVGADQGFAGRQFAGQIDEVYVFRSALSASRIAQYMGATRACASAINHFSISHWGSGVGCVDQQVTITAHDAAHTPVDANALTLSLTTSNAKGTWTGIQLGGGTLNDPVAGDGAAIYTFPPGLNSVTLLFRNANVAGTSETFSFNVSGGGFSETTGTAIAADDPSFTMYAAGFRVRNITDATDVVPTQIAAKPSDSGWNAKTLRLQAINTDSGSGSCTNLFASQTRTVDLGAECNNPAICAGAALSVNGTNLPTSADNGGAGATAYTGLSLNFNANSEADTVIAYPDAGLISLHARFDLNGAVAGYEMLGSSNSFVERPFGMAFPGVTHGTTAASPVLSAAGDPFAMTVTAYAWVSGEDADNDGVPDAGVNITDNGGVPNFAATATVSASANLPGVATGSITRGAGCVAPPNVALSGGTVTDNTWCYSEVGNVFLNAAVNDYLGAADADILGNGGLDGTGVNGYVGRFIPKRFNLVGAPVFTPRYVASCPGTTFAYMGEGIRLDGFTMRAINTLGNVTQNYDGAYARHDPVTGTAKTAFSIAARSGTTDYSTRVTATHLVVPAWSQGLLTAGGNPLQIALSLDRLPANTPDGPFAATGFGIAPLDPDNVGLPIYDLDVDNDATNEHLRVGTTDIRFGRLFMQNAYGTGGTILPVPLQLQYWSGSNFVVNGDDSCTTLNRSEIAMDFTPVSNLTACETAVNTATVPFASGVGTLILGAPGTSNNGSVLLTANLDSAAGLFCDPASYVAATDASKAYLLGRWDGGAAYDDKPSARAAFGIYGQPRNFIFFRENY